MSFGSYVSIPLCAAASSFPSFSSFLRLPSGALVHNWIYNLENMCHYYAALPSNEEGPIRINEARSKGRLLWLNICRICQVAIIFTYDCMGVGGGFSITHKAEQTGTDALIRLSIYQLCGKAKKTGLVQTNVTFFHMTPLMLISYGNKYNTCILLSSLLALKKFPFSCAH